MRPPPLRLSLLVWGLAVAFYLFGFFQRVAPASLADLLMRDFALSAAALGNLSALYYYTYAAVQLPTGVLVSRLGPTRLLLAGCLLAGSGALLFGLAQQAALAGLGRALIGAAHGMAWVSMLALVTHWFPPQRFGTVSGVSLMVGTVGAVLAGPPLRWLADEWGWRATLAGTGAVGLLLALLIWALVRDDPRERGHASFATAAADQPTVPLGQALRELFSSRNVWLLAGSSPSPACGACPSSCRCMGSMRRPPRSSRPRCWWCLPAARRSSARCRTAGATASGRLRQGRCWWRPASAWSRPHRRRRWRCWCRCC